MEALLGTALFARSGKALQLTATGPEYLQQVAAAQAFADWLATTCAEAEAEAAAALEAFSGRG
jgi:DNA-binding transcriptional LysR family regulator